MRPRAAGGGAPGRCGAREGAAHTVEQAARRWDVADQDAGDCGAAAVGRERQGAPFEGL